MVSIIKGYLMSEMIYIHQNFKTSWRIARICHLLSGDHTVAILLLNATGLLNCIRKASRNLQSLLDIVSRQCMSFMKLPLGATFPLPPKKKNTLINNSKILVNKNDGATHYLVFFYLFISVLSEFPCFLEGFFSSVKVYIFLLSDEQPISV